MSKVTFGENYHYVNVTERRAPTDESLRLLKEMQDSAKSEIYKSIRLPDNFLEGVVHFCKDHLSATTNVAVVFELNGNKHIVKVSLTDYLNQEEKMHKVMRAVSDEITVALFQQTFKPEFLIISNTICIRFCRVKV